MALSLLLNMNPTTTTRYASSTVLVKLEQGEQAGLGVDGGWGGGGAAAGGLDLGDLGSADVLADGGRDGCAGAAGGAGGALATRVAARGWRDGDGDGAGRGVKGGSATVVRRSAGQLASADQLGNGLVNERLQLAWVVVELLAGGVGREGDANNNSRHGGVGTGPGWVGTGTGAGAGLPGGLRATGLAIAGPSAENKFGRDDNGGIAADQGKAELGVGDEAVGL